MLFLIFIPTFIIAYAIPFLATIYSKTNARKWIFYWVSLFLANLIVKPILCFLFGPNGGSVLFLVTATVLVWISSNKRVQILIDILDTFFKKIKA